MLLLCFIRLPALDCNPPVCRSVQAVAEGPRATAAFCATAARLVAALAVSTASAAAGARFCEAVAQALQAAQARQDSLAGRNLALLLGHLCLTGLLGVDVIYSLLDALCQRWVKDCWAAVQLSGRAECTGLLHL